MSDNTLLFGNIEPIEIQEEMERSFLDYAMSVIISRALPDVRDGLKPVHRRILWDMEQQGFRPDRPFVKCARVTGDTMAKYHPHNSQAIYDALVRLAQPFSVRHPLIDFHGNYGSPDFGPAAERYTECRLSPLAMRLLDGIDENTVDFIPNYDGTTTQPVVLPARFPNLLVNGSQGIAVGMATSIPPHNLGEVIDATIHLIDHPEATPDDLMQFVKGPDFPTGGLILGRAGIMEAYRTGRGSVKMRAKAEIEEAGKRGDRFQIVVSEMPYQVSHDAVATRIKELADSGELDGIDDVNDETSQKTGTRFVIYAEARRQRQRRAQQPVQAHAAADELPREHGGAGRPGAAHAQPRAGPGRPTSSTRSRSSPGAASSAWPRRSAGPTSSRASSRPSTSSTRSSPSSAPATTAPPPATGLMVEPFSFSEEQAEHILDMRLGQLTRLSRIDLAGGARRPARHRSPSCEAILADEGRKRDGDQGRAGSRSRPTSPRRGWRSSPTTPATCRSRTSSTTRSSSSS